MTPPALARGSKGLTRPGRNRACPTCGWTKDADCAWNEEPVFCHRNTGHQAGKYEQNGWDLLEGWGRPVGAEFLLARVPRRAALGIQSRLAPTATPSGPPGSLLATVGRWCCLNTWPRMVSGSPSRDRCHK